MKTLRYLGMALAAITLTFSLASCGDDDDDEITPEEKTTDKTPDGVEAIDLGLPSGTKWANRNIGAEKSTDYGDYFAWGETVPYGKEDKSNLTNFNYNASDNYTKSVFYWGTYKWCSDASTGDNPDFTKYCTDSSYGSVDNKTELDPEDDAAYVNWGSDWRMPSEKQMDELTSKCTWTWTTTENGVNGYRVKGPNGNIIFLPAAGYRLGNSLGNAGIDGFYWSFDEYSNQDGYILLFSKSSAGLFCYYRAIGMSVRPVAAK